MWGLPRLLLLPINRWQSKNPLKRDQSSCFGELHPDNLISPWAAASRYSLQSQDVLRMMVPRANTGKGKKDTAFRYAAAWPWSDLQQDLRLPELMTWGGISVHFKGQEASSVEHWTVF